MLNRRRFVLSAAPLLVPASVFARPAPSDRLTMGFIGVGNNGTNWMARFLTDPRARVVAVCDVNRAGAGYWNGTVRGREPARRMVDDAYGDSSCRAFDDYRELLEMPDLDAIYIGTPDHWHAPIAIAAAEKGKHIYGQKPLSHNVAEGRRMTEAVERAGKVWQTGSQQRSDPYFRRVCELVREGALGKIRRVLVDLPDGTPDFGKTADQIQTVATPDGFDYDFWLGPAPYRPFCPARVGVNFRWVFDYSGGQVTDWGAHHIDIAHWGLGRDASGPVAIKNPKAEFAPGPVYDTATTFSFEAVYDDGVVVEVRSSSDANGVRFEGDDGWMRIARGGRWQGSDEKFVAREKKAIEKTFEESEAGAHVENFLDAVFDGAQIAAPIETAHRSVTVAHLGNIALRLGRDLRWDPRAERITDDASATEMLSRRPRQPWGF